MEDIIKKFRQLSEIPRESGNETAVREWLINWAKEHGFPNETDQKGNLVVRNCQIANKPPITLQAHLDMVCQKTSDSKHDFVKDPIAVIEDNGWLKAKDTSLGADNGIAIAILMQIAEEMEGKVLLELLFTVEEEIGLCGAKKLGEGMFTGNILINLDSEDEGVCTIGCAGGARTDIEASYKQINITDGNFYELSVSGLVGGHSGVDINKGRLNANKVLLELLSAVVSKNKINLISFEGGTVDNAIPRSAIATFVSTTNETEVRNIIDSLLPRFKSVESGVNIELKSMRIENKLEGMSDVDSSNVIQMLNKIPNGVISEINTELVECSSNLGVLKIFEGKIKCDILSRSSNNEKLDETINDVTSIAEKYGYSVRYGEKYPGWNPNFDSALLKKAKEIYKQIFNKDLIVDVIHAGLECGILVKKGKNVDAISLGPTIKSPHSPDEKVEIRSIEKLYKYIKNLLISL